jgi:hypothetical protein
MQWCTMPLLWIFMQVPMTCHRSNDNDFLPALFSSGRRSGKRLAEVILLLARVNKRLQPVHRNRLWSLPHIIFEVSCVNWKELSVNWRPNIPMGVFSDPCYNNKMTNGKHERSLRGAWPQATRIFGFLLSWDSWQDRVKFSLTQKANSAHVGCSCQRKTSNS